MTADETGSRSHSSPQTPGAFARELLRPGTISARYVGKTGQDTLVLADYDARSVDCGYGGWEEYNRAEITSEVPLKHRSYQGRRVDSMCRQEVEIDGNETVAFVTDYSQGTVTMRQAHSQMAVWAFCDSLGLLVPRHHWFPDSSVVVVEKVGGMTGTAKDPVSVDREVVNHINPAELLDHISVLLIAGNADLRPPNIKIGDEGQIYTFDFDASDQSFESTGALHVACGKALGTIRVLDEVRDNPLEIDAERICARVTALATELQSSPHMDRILGTVELYDDIFRTETNQSFETLIRSNIMVLSDIGD